MNLRLFLKEDLKANILLKDVRLKHFLFNFFFNYRYRIIIRLRIAQYCQKKGFIGRKISLIFYWMNLRRSIDISTKAVIGYGLRIAHPIGIVIGDRVVIGNYCSILQNVTIGGNSGKTYRYNGQILYMPYIEDFIQLSPGACVLGPVVIKKYAVIGANSVVTKNVNEYEVVVGIPCKVLSILTKEKFSSTLYNLLKNDA